MGFFSNLLGSKESESKAEMMKMFKLISRIIDDEEFQNSLGPLEYAKMLAQKPAVDMNPGATGEFGFSENNPIPVNGALGELSYLSKLETNQGERIVFHRIGAINQIDVFEAVTFSGSAWFVFFVDLYHPRRSRKAPAGFRLSAEMRQFSGFHNNCKNFPYDYPEARQAQTKSDISLGYMPTGNIVPQLEKRVFERPLAHKAKLDIVKSKMTSTMTA